MQRRPDLVAVLALVAAWLAIVALVGLGGEFALNDDWAYTLSARRLAHTGELRILDWAAPSLVSHIAWGAALVRLIGDSQVVLRLGTLAWALGALLTLYALARRRFPPGPSLTLTLALGLSPWFVNLSFTYMTDVPWLAMMLGAMALAAAPGASPARLAMAGLLVGLAALSRQFAVVTVPGFLLVLAADVGPHCSRRRSLGRMAAFVVPVVVLFVAFHLWYTRVHGPTLANQQTWDRMHRMRVHHPISHLLAVWHYVGLWLLPFALAALRRDWRRMLRPWPTAVAALVLSCFAAVLAVEGDPKPSAHLHPWMPYLGNIAFLVGVGPTTIFDVYQGFAPTPHAGRWLGWVLTALSTVGGTLTAAWLALGLRRFFVEDLRLGAMWRAWLRGSPGAPLPPESRTRLLVVSVSLLYLAWHVGTATFLFDRYVFVLLPAAVWLALDAAPAATARAPLVVAALALMALVSIAGTREYLAWNAARAEAVRALEAQGIAPADIDGGFEINGPRRFAAEVARRGGAALHGSWWGEGARYRLSFWPPSAGECRQVARHPYWTWPGGGSPAIHTLDCAPVPGR